MSSIFIQNNIWHIRVKIGEKWITKTTSLPLNQKRAAQETLEKICQYLSTLDQLEKDVPLNEVENEQDFTPLTVAHYAKVFLHRRNGTIKDIKHDEARINKYILPHIGKMYLPEVKPRHLIKMISELRKTDLAPRTIRNIYQICSSIFKSSIKDDICSINPCILGTKELGKISDKHPEWRAAAFFKKEEINLFISDERIPRDKQVFYGLLALAGLRRSEAVGLRFKDFNKDTLPLWQLVIAHSNEDEKIKTANLRLVPVHSTLQAILEQWQNEGFAKTYGRNPLPNDFICPQSVSNNQSAIWTKDKVWRRFQADLRTLNLKPRRMHDFRRSFITHLRSDGAKVDFVRLFTHPPNQRDMMDAYSSIGWEPLCLEISKLKI